MGRLKIILFVLRCATHHQEVEISSNLTRTIVSTIGQGGLKKQAQESAMITAYSVAAVKS